MSKPQVTTQIRIQSENYYWFTVEDIYLDVGCSGLTVSYWEERDGRGERITQISIDEKSALPLADAIYKLFKKEDN